MNELDQFARHRLKAKYYGRYVDDMVLFDEDPVCLIIGISEWMNS